MYQKRLLNASAIIVSCGSKKYKAGVIVCTGNLVFIPTIAEVPKILLDLVTLENGDKIKMIGSEIDPVKKRGYVILQPTNPNSAGVIALSMTISGSMPCDVCGGSMQRVKNQYTCNNCGNTRNV